MTLSERIEAARRALYDTVPYGDPPVPWETVKETNPREAGGIRDETLTVLRSFAPELFTTPPTAWIAPWDPADSDGMHDAAMEAVSGRRADGLLGPRGDFTAAYYAARDAHLKANAPKGSD